jgi:hypothetical protein
VSYIKAVTSVRRKGIVNDGVQYRLRGPFFQVRLKQVEDVLHR